MALFRALAALLLATAWAASAGAQGLGASVDATQQANARCFCHGKEEIAKYSPKERLSMVAGEAPTGPSVRPGMYVPTTALDESVHKGLACLDCHKDAATLPHAQKLGPPSCDSACHAMATADFLQGSHAEAVARGDANAPTCATCHGGHDILPKGDRRSKTYPLNIVEVCGDCHRKQLDVDSDGRTGKDHVAMYLQSVHGRAVVGQGLAVAATCADCHGNHRILPGRRTESMVSRENIALTCSGSSTTGRQCHVGVSEVYQKSVHGQKLSEGDPKAPVCTDCHTAHAISQTNTPAFMLDIVGECGQCHDKPPAGSTRKTSLYSTYRRSYHGQVAQLSSREPTAAGSIRAARCSDCHGAHDIRRINDPASRLSAANRVETCRGCHKEANASFALFEPHADFYDGQRYPVLHAVWVYFICIMSFAFGFFGLHSLLWLTRSIIERARNGPRPKFSTDTHAIKRFNRVDRVNHAFVILSFFGLSLTGLPLLFADQGWAKVLAEMLGGVRQAGLIHRFFAIMLIVNFLVHFVGVVRRFKKYSARAMLFGPTTMLPRGKDVRDCFGMIRWFFRGGKKPEFDRWTYWEKFDYTAEVFGSLVIGLSGLLLWFPQTFSLIVPGWMFNVATIVHGYEALLAVGFIFTIHFYNAHLRLEKFPADDVMFTGRLSEEEFKHERGAEYARLVAEGKLESLRVPPSPWWYRKAAVGMGIVAMAIGMTLVVLIIVAGLQMK